MPGGPSCCHPIIPCRRRTRHIRCEVPFSAGGGGGQRVIEIIQSRSTNAGTGAAVVCFLQAWPSWLRGLADAPDCHTRGREPEPVLVPAPLLPFRAPLQGSPALFSLLSERLLQPNLGSRAVGLLPIWVTSDTSFRPRHLSRCQAVNQSRHSLTTAATALSRPLSSRPCSSFGLGPGSRASCDYWRHALHTMDGPHGNLALPSRLGSSSCPCLTMRRPAQLGSVQPVALRPPAAAPLNG